MDGGQKFKLNSICKRLISSLISFSFVTLVFYLVVLFQRFIGNKRFESFEAMLLKELKSNVLLDFLLFFAVLLLSFAIYENLKNKKFYMKLSLYGGTSVVAGAIISYWLF